MDPEQSIKSTPAAPLWEDIGIRHHHGIALPLFALHSKSSCGIGEFPDLLPLLPWCVDIGFDIIQLLPLNDTGNDTSPYSALSANALNPIYLGLSQLSYLDENVELLEEIKELQKLNVTQRIPYSAVQTGKDKFLRKYYRHYSSNTANTTPYQSFKNDNPWLIGYALFKALKIHFHWQSWEEWPSDWKDPPPAVIQQIPKEFADEAEYHIFVQYLCFEQIENVKRQASKLDIFIKGDLPILINRDSADVWLNRHMFLLDYEAGAPPDMYAKEGQKWGFSPYNWDAVESDGYRWWKERLRVAAHCYHIYRIDHIVGFYRIWSIPIGLTSKEGHFIPSDEGVWISHGEKIMRMMLANCPMLPIGEDLGTIPPEVRINLKNLGICGTKVMRWERRWHGDQGFIDPKDYPAESMTTVSTHDSETLQLWWSNQPEESKIYAETMGWEYSPELTQEHRRLILRSSHHSGSLFHINLLGEYLALIPGMTWPSPSDERINLPGVISDLNWTYRFRPSVEKIVNNEELKQTIKDLLPNERHRF